LGDRRRHWWSRSCPCLEGGVLSKSSSIAFLIFVFSRSFILCCLIDSSNGTISAPFSLVFFPVCVGVFSWEWLFGNNFFGRGRFPSIFGTLDSPGQGCSDALSG
jgi:hypothetical protein